MTHGDPKRGGRHGDAGLKIGHEGMKPVTDFIDLAVAEEKPFFAWYAPFLPHTPHNLPERLLNKYTKDGRAQDVAKYFAMCEWFDETCGELLNHLDAKGIRDNAIVLYICDNGWAAKSTNASDPNQKTWGGFALRSKGSPYENGIRTPILVSWPDRLKPERSGDFGVSLPSSIHSRQKSKATSGLAVRLIALFIFFRRLILLNRRSSISIFRSNSGSWSGSIYLRNSGTQPRHTA